MKNFFYVFCFTILGVLLSFLLHAIIESAVISLLTKDFERFSLGLNWEQWFVVHRVGSVILLSVGVIFGLQQGRLWWRILYVEKHFNLKKKNQLIILDFDHTVFNTTKYVNELKRVFEKDFGIDGQTFTKSREEVKKCCEVIDIDEFVKRLPHANKKKMHKTLIKTTKQIAAFLVFKDAPEFIKRHLKNFDVLLLTHGDAELQHVKVKASRLPKGVKVLVSLQKKDQAVARYIDQYEQVHFVDDKNKNIDLVKTSFPQIHTYFIKRPQDHPYGHVDSVCQCADHTVEDLSFAISV